MKKRVALNFDVMWVSREWRILGYGPVYTELEATPLWFWEQR